MALRLALVTLLAAVVAGACSAGAPSPSTTASPAPASASTGVPVEPPTAAASPSAEPTDAPTPTPTIAPTASPEPTPTPAPSMAAGVPAPPTHVAMSHEIGTSQPQGYAQDVTTTVRWQEAQPEGVTIRVYGVTACLPKHRANHTPCLTKGTPLPANVRELIASAPASDGHVSWVWPEWDDIGGAVIAHGGTIYQSVVVAAYDKAGHSKFVIVATAEYCTDCVY